MTTPQAQPEKRKPAKIDPEPGGQLEQILMANKQAHDLAAQYKEEESDTKSQVKNYLLSLYAGREHELPDSFVIAADPHGRYPGYTMTLKSGTHIDYEILKGSEPPLFAAVERYRVPNKPSWELRENTGGGRR
jgi:hypothetical protein